MPASWPLVEKKEAERILHCKYGKYETLLIAEKEKEGVKKRNHFLTQGAALLPGYYIGFCDTNLLQQFVWRKKNLFCGMTHRQKRLDEHV